MPSARRTGRRQNDSDTLRRVFYLHYMAREVLETLHPEWVGAKRGFGAEGFRRAEAMLDERARSGVAETPDSSRSIDLTPDGFVVKGEPRTPPRHWATLISELTQERIRTLKTLAVPATA
jgi:hypothetical protein